MAVQEMFNFTDSSIRENTLRYDDAIEEAWKKATLAEGKPDLKGYYEAVYALREMFNMGDPEANTDVVVEFFQPSTTPENLISRSKHRRAPEGALRLSRSTKVGDKIFYWGALYEVTEKRRLTHKEKDKTNYDYQITLVPIDETGKKIGEPVRVSR